MLLGLKRDRKRGDSSGTYIRMSDDRARRKQQLTVGMTRDILQVGPLVVAVGGREGYIEGDLKFSSGGCKAKQ